MKFKNKVTKVNTETGEITTEESKEYFIKVSDPDKFFMIFIDSISSLFNIRSATDRAVLDFLASLADYESNKVRIVADDRKQLASQLNISLQAITNSLANLKKLGIITGDNGSFYINPYIMWKGSTQSRAKLLKEKGLELKILFKADE